jgi:hypothetical protein
MAQTLNPPFDPRILNIGNPAQSGRLKRGWITHAPLDGQGSKRGFIGRVNFLYNPSAVNVSHPVSVDFAAGAGTKDPNDVSQVGNVVGIGSLSVQLLYDRTYELWDGSKRNTPAGKFGMYADVLAFYHFLGMTSVTEADPPVPWTREGYFGTESAFWATQYPITPATLTLAYLYIGDKLKYYGAVNGLEVTYTHWSKDMIPMRGAVTISMQLQADPNKSPKVQVGQGKPQSNLDFWTDVMNGKR